MRIAIDARFLNETPSPLGQYCENLIEHLSQADSLNEYIVFIHAGFPKRLRVGQNFTIRALRSDPISLRTLYRFRHQVERVNPDLFHALYPIVPPNYQGKMVVTVHDLKTFLVQQTVHQGLQMRMRLSHAFCKWMFPIAVRRADVLACVSNSTRQSLNDVFPGSIHRSIVIRSGIEPSYMTPLDDTTRDLVLAKHRPPKRYFYYTGPIRESKNVPNMLMAFAALRSQDGNYSNLNFLIDSPPGRELEEIRRLVRAMRIHEVVRLYDSIADSERRVFYDRSEALCFACKNEGFGFPVLEAQATGTPVLAADSGALPEVAGPGALLVDPDRVDSIMEGMRRILSDTDLRADLVRTGNRNVKNFSWKKTAEQTRDLYNAVL